MSLIDPDLFFKIRKLFLQYCKSEVVSEILILQLLKIK